MSTNRLNGLIEMLSTRSRRKILPILKRLVWIVSKCGGIGSGIPGPCPLNKPKPSPKPRPSAKPPDNASSRLRSGETLHNVSQGKDRIWRTADGKPAPEHIQKLKKLPSQWNKDGTPNPNALKNVQINLDPKGDCLARGRDSKGREKREYSDNHNMRAAADKFGRVSELRKKRVEIFNEVEKDIKSGKSTEEALCTKLIMKTGMRPGSTKDTKAEHKSYGATTLEGRHIVQKPDGSVSVKFVPGKKKGQEIEMPIHDKVLASQLLEKSKKTGPNGKLFDTTAESVRSYSKTKDGGGFKTKDHRTALGTETAVAAIQSHPTPKSVKEYKAALKTVSTKVSDVLGNTPSIAFKSYIDPNVWSDWKQQSGA